MDHDKMDGKGDELKGKAKEGFGKLTGDKDTEAEGKGDQAKGKVKNTVGNIKDKVKDAVD
ncbi:MAG: CsbD family protein [Chloroflexi bacterium]|nr:CsbD family protein [Chloroflexota bacterium]